MYFWKQVTQRVPLPATHHYLNIWSFNLHAKLEKRDPRKSR